jgi:uncharacterized membrane protein YkoI
MKRTTKLITGAAMVAVLTGAGVSYAVAQDSGAEPIRDPDLQRASDAAIAEAGGTVVGVETDDGRYEVEVRLDDGTEIDVDLDPDFRVLSTEADRDDDGADRDDDGAGLDDATRQRVGDAAMAAVGGGTVVGVEPDDGGYDVEVRLADGSEVDVDLAADLTVLRTEDDDD